MISSAPSDPSYCRRRDRDVLLGTGVESLRLEPTANEDGDTARVSTIERVDQARICTNSHPGIGT
jgi:hypothetical protein